MSTAPKDFPRAWDLLLLAAVNGWAVAWQPNEDTGGAQYVSVRAVRGFTEHRITWHTRRPDGTTGTPRMFSALTSPPRCLGFADTTLAKVRADITREVQP